MSIHRYECCRSTQRHTDDSCPHPLGVECLPLIPRKLLERQFDLVFGNHGGREDDLHFLLSFEFLIFPPFTQGWYALQSPLFVGDRLKQLIPVVGDLSLPTCPPAFLGLFPPQPGVGGTGGEFVDVCGLGGKLVVEPLAVY